MDKKTITIVVGIIVGFIVLRWIYLWSVRRKIPFYTAPYERARCVSYGGGKTCCGSLRFNNITNEYVCIDSSN